MERALKLGARVLPQIVDVGEGGVGGGEGREGRAGPPITGILFVNLPNSRSPNQ